MTATLAPARPRHGHWRRWLAAAVALAASGLVLAALPRLVRHLDPAAVGLALANLPAGRIAAAIALTAASHLLLTLYDRIALATMGRALPWPTVARAAFTSYTLSHNLGFAALTGGSARMLIYGRAGVPPAIVARVVVIAGLAFWGGIVAVAALALLFHGQPITLFGARLAPLTAHVAGAAALAGFALLPFAPRLVPDTARLPGALALAERPLLVAGLLAIAAADIAISSLALLVLVPTLGAGDFPQLFLAYALAVIAGLIAHVPGGIGVFEGTILGSLRIHGPQLAAALIAYRAIYYLLPLAVSVALNAALELRRAWHRPGTLRGMARFIGMEAGPPLMAAATFGAGLVLILSGVLPAVHGRLHALRDLVPLPFVEAAHLGASAVGAALLLVAPALLSRSRAGWKTARTLLLCGAALSLGKGLDFEEAAALLAVAGLLHRLGPAFYRRALGAFDSHNRGWLLAAVLAVLAASVSGLAAYPHASLQTAAWWHFAWRADLSRYLRASFAACAVVAAFAVRELLSRPPVRAGMAALPWRIFAAATAASGRSDAMLALTGDKRFVTTTAQDAFLMFRPAGRTWFVMGDPVGPVASWPELVWKLRRDSDLAGVRLCFYQVSDAFLPLAVELGLHPVKYGEEAVVPLDRFTLAGPEMKGLRNSHARACREGLTLAILPASADPARLEPLRPISNRWLARHGGREKRFSLGAFDPGYLAQCDLALVSGPDGAPLAFANLWHSGDGTELSIDLMRQTPDAPPATMDFLMVELILRAQDQAFVRFNLGVAPLSGMRGGRLAPAWARGANLAFGLRRISYNFQGLRRYKEKFRPAWHNRYIALPQGLAGYRAMIQLIRLIGQ